MDTSESEFAERPSRRARKRRRRGGLSSRATVPLPQAPMPPYARNGLAGGLSVGSACTGWAAESQALSMLQVNHQMQFVCDSDTHVQLFLAAHVAFERLHADVFSEQFQREQHVEMFTAGPPCFVYDPIMAYINQARPHSVPRPAAPRFEPAAASSASSTAGSLLPSDSVIRLHVVFSWTKL